MKTFIDWTKENNKQLPEIDENSRRAGISKNYPDAYAGKGYAYPDLHFTPISANAPGKLAGKMGS